MSNKNELLKFAGGDDPNVTPFSQWENLPAVKTGFKSGIAKSAELNRVFAQGALASNVLGAFVVEHAHEDATLNSDLYAGFKKGLRNFVAGNVGVGSIQPKHLTPTFDVSSLTFSVKQATSNARGRSVYATGELVFDTDTKKLYAGDGVTAGGLQVGSDLTGALTASNLNAYARDISNWKVKAGNGSNVPALSFVGAETFALKNEGATLDLSKGADTLAQFGGDTLTVKTDLSLTNKKIKNLGAPTVSTDAVNKGYVDTEIARAVSGIEPADGIVTDNNFGSKNRTLPNLTVTGSVTQGSFSTSGNSSQWSVSRGSTTILGVSTSSVSVNNKRITNVSTPTSYNDAATKSYVDGKCSGFATESWVTGKGYATTGYVASNYTSNTVRLNKRKFVNCIVDPENNGGNASLFWHNRDGRVYEVVADANWKIGTKSAVGSFDYKNLLDLSPKGDLIVTGTIKSLGSFISTVKQMIGAVAYFKGRPPEGWLLCNGAAVPTSCHELRAMGITSTPSLIDAVIAGTYDESKAGKPDTFKFVPVSGAQITTSMVRMLPYMYAGHTV